MQKNNKHNMIIYIYFYRLLKFRILGAMCNPTNAKGKWTNKKKSEHSYLASITANYTQNIYRLQYYEHFNFQWNVLLIWKKSKHSYLAFVKLMPK